MSFQHPTPGDFAEQDHLIDPADTDGSPFQHLAPGYDDAERTAAVVALYDREPYLEFLARTAAQFRAARP